MLFSFENESTGGNASKKQIRQQTNKHIGSKKDLWNVDILRSVDIIIYHSDGVLISASVFKIKLSIFWILSSKK